MVEWLASNKMTPFMSEVTNLVTYAIPDLQKVPNDPTSQRLEKTPRSVLKAEEYKIWHWYCKVLGITF